MARWIGSVTAWALVMACGSTAFAADAVEATVNGEAITASQIDAAFARTSVSQQPLTESQRQMYRAHVLNVLIDNVLLKQYLDDKGITADPKAVEDHIAGFQKALAEKGSSLDAFLRENQATPEQMNREIGDLFQWFAHVDTQATDANLRAYFNENKAAFDGSQVRASHILAEFHPTATPEEKQAAFRRIKDVQRQLAAGTDFASLAKQHSDCQSKAQGGDVGFFPRKGKMTEPFARAAFSLDVGQVSDVVESEYGYHLIKVTDKRAGQTVRFETVRDDVKSLFAADLRGAIIAAMRKQGAVELSRPTATAQEPSVPLTR